MNAQEAINAGFFSSGDLDKSRSQLPPPEGWIAYKTLVSPSEYSSPAYGQPSIAKWKTILMYHPTTGYYREWETRLELVEVEDAR